MAKAQPAQQTKITRNDLESKFRAFQGEVQGKVDDKKQTLVAAGAGHRDVLDARVLPPRAPQRQEEDDAGRDPPGLTDGKPPPRAVAVRADPQPGDSTGHPRIQPVLARRRRRRVRPAVPQADLRQERRGPRHREAEPGQLVQIEAIAPPTRRASGAGLAGARA